MCGISGIVDKRDAPIDAQLLERVTDAVAHRGPDGRGCFHGRNFAFGHRRLSILDLSDHGQQPMVYRGRYRITYNGEVYNYVELRRELEGRGHSFLSGTDTEVILAAYAEWGADCCSRFNGMWAFAIHDAEEQSIFFARDRFGVKPLYYLDTPQRFAFGSEIKQLLPLLPTVRANRRVLLDSLLMAMDESGEETYFEGVRSFPASHCGTYDLRAHGLSIRRYYTLTEDPAVRRLSLDDAISGFRAVFEDAVRLRLRSDVRVGTCLSGGLDSSATSAVASRLFHTASADRFLGVHARATDAERDESAFARLAANHLGIELHIVEPRTEDFLDRLDELVDTQEEPFGSPSMFMGWHVFQRAAAIGCKVMLNGQGGDEALLGYERYFASMLTAMSPVAFLREAFAQARHSKLSLKDVALYNLYFRNAALRIAALKRRSFVRHDLKKRHDFSLVRDSARSFSEVQSLQRFEITRVPLPQLLRYEDRNSMRHSVETRLPFLDYRLLEFAVSLPLRYKIRNGWTKYVLRRAIEGALPAESAWRKDKIGFEAPERSWIGTATERMLDTVSQSRILAEITNHRKLLERYRSLPLRRRWDYFIVAAWERHFGVGW